MFKFIAVIFLTVHAAVVLGIMTIDDLPEAMVNCLENIVAPAIRERESARENCENLPDDEVGQCKRNVEDEFHSKGISECLGKKDELPETQRIFAYGYYMNTAVKDRYAEIPQNMRDCLDSVKSLGQSTFQSANHCELLMRARNSNEGENGSERRNNPYEDCMGKLVEKVLEDPQASKCIEIDRTLTMEQRRLSGPYFFSVVFNQ